MIRASLLEDKQFLIDLFTEEQEVLSGFPMATQAEVEDSCQFWIDLAAKGYGLTYLIEGKIAGMAVLYLPLFTKLKKAALFSIVVSKAFRRQNVATHLITALEQLGKTSYGLSIIHLEVYEKNEAARNLYQKLGFQEYGVQEKFIKEKGAYFSKVLMQKHL